MANDVTKELEMLKEGPVLKYTYEGVKLLNDDLDAWEFHPKKVVMFSVNTFHVDDFLEEFPEKEKEIVTKHIEEYSRGSFYKLVEYEDAESFFEDFGYSLKLPDTGNIIEKYLELSTPEAFAKLLAKHLTADDVTRIKEAL